MTYEPLLPVRGCLVTRDEMGLGVVQDTVKGTSGWTAKVFWTQPKEYKYEAVDGLRSAFKIEMEVQHRTTMIGWESLGLGKVLRSRSVAGSEQVLVGFFHSSKRRWLPYQVLEWVKGPAHRFQLNQFEKNGGAERMRLRTLAHGIENWHQSTGALSGLDIDPLPHQIHLVHHIVNSGNLNWMIADDVGLGKTIETGMLISALKRRDEAKRVLLVTPAGLTKQWQEELYEKFGLDGFRIYGSEFTIDEPRHWKMYDHVIASIDRLKSEDHLELLRHAEPWDLVIFDEAHRLSRRQYGMKFDSSQRFDLARTLRPLAKAMVLLTATPHQGKQDKFQSLLQLLRPERKEDIRDLALNPEILGEMVFRNNKSDVTDAEGNFIFHGKTTKSISVGVSPEAVGFDKALQEYLKEGYAAGDRLGFKGNAIGFVMTVYRKLATSSAAAIMAALQRRRLRLMDDGQQAIAELAESDERFVGETQELFEGSATEFFQGELELLDDLIEKCHGYLASDAKLKGFLEHLTPQVLARNQNEKILIFTEYRSTQDYLHSALAKHFGTGKVSLINGSMDQASRKLAIQQFEGDGQFLISTEAGGEGINLQSKCHIMVNYDLPWNPMRLVQRIGRLYRYGQKKRVVVFNMQAKNTLDDQITQLMYERIDQVVMDMATLGTEFNERLHDDIVGEIADLIDVEEILENANGTSIDRTAERIEEALQRAKEAAEKQQDLFAHAETFDASRLADKINIDSEHLNSFVEGMFAVLGIEVVERTHSGKVWTLHFSEAQLDELGTRRSRRKVTFDRIIASQSREIDFLWPEHFLLDFLLKKAKSYDFGGLVSAIKLTHASATEAAAQPSTKLLAAGYLCWQDPNGLRRNQEFSLWALDEEGKIAENPRTWQQCLIQPWQDGGVEKYPPKELLSILDSHLDDQLSARTSGLLLPELRQLVCIGQVRN
ncbi:helicase-related protein [Microbulbifer sp. M83]|uniref:helicase-related protein n=1 Tax=Microbulbifer sp. M83 TaxID=3118246 RepID=UPI002FE2AD4E